jgi:hypothetical protein
MRTFDGAQPNENQLYHYEQKWLDNETFVAVDAIVAYVTARAPRSEVYPASDSPESKIWAKHLEKYHEAWADKFDLARKYESSVMNLLLQHIGILTIDWCPDYGECGELLPRVVNPTNFFIDKNAKLGENPQFCGEVLKGSV